MKPLEKTKGLFYGYWILAAIFFLLFIHAGVGFYAFSLFVKPLEVHFGWNRASVMVGFTVYGLVMGLTSPFVGRMIDRYGARRVVALGGAACGLAFILASLTSSLPFFYFSYALFGAGQAAAGQIPASVIVSNWFKKRRGLAIGLVGIGIGAGGLTMAPIIGSFLIPTFGWQKAYFTLAMLIWAVFIPVALLVIRTRPADMGLYADGETAPAPDAAGTKSAAVEGLTLKMALKTPAFWMIAGSFLLGSCSQIGIVQNQAPHLQDIGFPVAIAATALGANGFGSAIGKFAFGWVCDWIPPKYAYAIGYCFQLAATIILINISPQSPVIMVWLYALLMGLGIGSWLPTLSLLTASTFGLVAYGTIWGMISGISSIGNSSGPVIAGYIHDSTQSYRLAFNIFIGLYIASITTMLLVRRPKARPTSATSDK